MQDDLQEMMQSLVGIVRTESEMREALRAAAVLQGTRGPRVGVSGHREYNTGWHTALDLRNLLTVSEAITRLGASSARRAAAVTSARTIPDKDPEFGTINIVVKAAADGNAGVARCRSGDAGGTEAGDRGEKQ